MAEFLDENISQLSSRTFISAFEMKEDWNDLRRLTSSVQCSCVPKSGFNEDLDFPECLVWICSTRWQCSHKMGASRVVFVCSVFFFFLFFPLPDL